MRRLAKAVAALSLVAAASIGGAAMASPAAASTHNTLVDITIHDVLNGNEIVLLQDIDAAVAAAVCSLDVSVLTDIISAQENGDKTECTGLATLLQEAWIVKK